MLRYTLYMLQLHLMIIVANGYENTFIWSFKKTLSNMKSIIHIFVKSHILAYFGPILKFLDIFPMFLGSRNLYLTELQHDYGYLVFYFFISQVFIFYLVIWFSIYSVLWALLIRSSGLGLMSLPSLNDKLKIELVFQTLSYNFSFTILFINLGDTHVSKFAPPLSHKIDDVHCTYKC